MIKQRCVFCFSPERPGGPQVCSRGWSEARSGASGTRGEEHPHSPLLPSSRAPAGAAEPSPAAGGANFHPAPCRRIDGFQPISVLPSSPPQRTAGCPWEGGFSRWIAAHPIPSSLSLLRPLGGRFGSASRTVRPRGAETERQEKRSSAPFSTG